MSFERAMNLNPNSIEIYFCSLCHPFRHRTPTLSRSPQYDCVYISHFTMLFDPNQIPVLNPTWLAATAKFYSHIPQVDLVCQVESPNRFLLSVHFSFSDTLTHTSLVSKSCGIMHFLCTTYHNSRTNSNTTSTISVWYNVAETNT